MKQLILIILLTASTFAQHSGKMLLLMDDGGYKNAETKLYLASLTTPISKTYAATLDSFITKVKDSLSITSLSSKFDVMYDLGGYSQEQSLKNLVKRSSDATAVNSPTWTQWQGFIGNGTSSYVNTDYNPFTQGVVANKNSVSLGIYSRTNVINSATAIGSYNGTTLFELVANPTAFYSRVLGSATLPTLPSGTGFWVGNRTSSTVIQGFYNGLQVGTDKTIATADFPNYNVYLDARNSSGTAAGFHILQESFAFIGSGLTTAEVLKFTRCVEWLMDRKGTGVIP